MEEIREHWHGIGEMGLGPTEVDYFDGQGEVEVTEGTWAGYLSYFDIIS